MTGSSAVPGWGIVPDPRRGLGVCQDCGWAFVREKSPGDRDMLVGAIRCYSCREKMGIAGQLEIARQISAEKRKRKSRTRPK